MKRKLRNTAAAKRRTTLALPVETLSEAKRIAGVRHVNLSTVISEALSEGLRQLAVVERSQHVLNSYKRAFRCFSDEEMLVLEGVMIGPDTEC
jgi:hypothetical protein